MNEIVTYPDGRPVVPVVSPAPETAIPRPPGDPNPPTNVSWFIVAALALAGFVGLMASGYVPFGALAHSFPLDVLAILITLDLFSLYVVQTGALDALGLKLALATKGRADIAAIFMGLLMFASSALLNNLAAIFIIAPVFLTLLRAMRARTEVTAAFLSLMLVLCNLGGMATPMGDFPAILLMSSGLVGFTPYLIGAFPLAASLALIAILGYSAAIRGQQAALSSPEDASHTRISLEFMRVRNRHVRPDITRAILLGVVFAGMVLAWALVPPSNWPFFMTALVGAAAATVIAGPRLGREAIGNYDLRTTVFMAIILTIAAIVSVTGIVGAVANALVAATPDETLLLVALMTLVAIAAGLFSAGPATAAVLPIFITLSHGPLASYGDMVGIAFAASICAGSSMLMHSATAGPTLRGETVKAGFSDENGHAVWGAKAYLKFGLLTALAQLVLSIAWILLAANMHASWLINLVPLGLLLVVGGTVFVTAGGTNSAASNAIGKGLRLVGFGIAAGAIAYGAATALNFI